LNVIYAVNVFPLSTIGSTIFFLIKNFTEPLASVMVRTEAIYPVSTHLTVVAASSDSRRKYSTGSAAASNFQTVYGLVQCTPDLSETDYNRCLDGCISEISSCCQGRMGARVLRPSCNIRFESAMFYNQTPKLDPDVTPPSPSPPSSVGTCHC